MPADYLIDVDRKLVISRAWGAVTDYDVREHHQRLRTDPLFDPTYRQLVDMSGITDDLVGIETKREVSGDRFSLPASDERGSHQVTTPSGWRECTDAFSECLSVFTRRFR